MRRAGLPAREVAAALLLVRHAARAVAELAPARAAGPQLVVVGVERLRQRRGEARLHYVRLGGIGLHAPVFGRSHLHLKSLAPARATRARTTGRRAPARAA